jgi:multidrug efflux pump subunit AcrB
MAQIFIDSALSPLLYMAVLGFGILGLLFTPREEDPQISVPLVDIFITYPGASARQVERLATEPLERIVSEMPGVKHVYSTSEHGGALVTVRFKVGEDLESSLVKLYDKLESNWDRIPPGVGPPLVKPKSIDDVPVVTVTLWSLQRDDQYLRTLALDVLQTLKGIRNTGQGFVAGGRTDQIRVEVKPERLSGYHISLDQIAQTIKTANSENRAGRAEKDTTSFIIYTGGFLHDADDIANLMIAVRHGAPVYIRDVADVAQQPEETWQVAEHYTGEAYQGADPPATAAPAVTIAIAKKKGSNGVTVANDILATLDSLKGCLIPDDVYITISRNYGKTANDKVNELLLGLFEATVAVSILSWLALGFRSAVVVITVIPVVILITVSSAWVLGYSINRVSLFALIFAIGILVDDATVVVENIYRRWLKEGNTTISTAVDAVREVGNPTIVATFAVLAALLPMGFVTGMMGPYMLPIPVLGSAAMLFSLIAAFVFTPWMTRRIRPDFAALHKAEQRERRMRETVHRYYRPLLTPLFNHRAAAWAFLIGIIVLFFLALSMLYTRAVAVKMLPLDNKPEFNVVINMPEGTSLPTTANLTRRMALLLRDMPEVVGVQTYMGTVSPYNFNGMVRHYYLRKDPWHADIQIQLLDKDDRERSSHEIAVEARRLLTPFASEEGARIAVVEMPPGPPVLQTLVAEVYGPTPPIRRQTATDLTRIFEATPNVVDVDNFILKPIETLRFVINTEKARRRGISVDAINHNLQMALGSHQVSDIKQGKTLEPVYIVIQMPMWVRSSTEYLGDLPIESADGRTVPLSELGVFVRAPEDPVIYHKDLQPIEYVVAETEGRLGAPIYAMLAIEDELNDYIAPDGVGLSGRFLGPPPNGEASAFEWTGEWTVTYETFRDMGLAFIAALLLIYILIVAEFDNFILPLVVMTPIPLTLIGILPGHWLFDAEFTATSMIGFIALAGILVRNSILIVDFARTAVDSGLEIHEAVLQACETRMRPVVITDLTMMASAAALIFDPIFQGMAISLLFGPIAATSLTFIVIPMGCISAGRYLHSSFKRRED